MNGSSSVAPAFLRHSERITDAFGRWPSFHDAEILQVVLERADSPSLTGPRVGLVILAWETDGSKTTAQGLCVQSNHHLIYFEFGNVEGVSLGDFNHQNVLIDLRFQQESRHDGKSRCKIVLQSIFGLGGEFFASEGEVVAVVPCDDQGRKLPT